MNKLQLLWVLAITISIVHCGELQRPNCLGSFGSIPDPEDSEKYYMCLFNQPIEKKCETGHYFDVNSVGCKLKSSALRNEILTTFPQPPISLTTPFEPPIGPPVSTTPVVPPVSTTTVPPITITPSPPTMPPPSNCPVHCPPFGIHRFPHTNNCNQFYLCVEGNCYEMTCIPGHIFDFYDLICRADGRCPV